MTARTWLLVAMTGAGREAAVAALAGAGVEVVDNLPADLVAAVASRQRSAPAVVCVDARRGDELAAVTVPAGAGVLVLDAADGLLVRRAADTTVPHPCAAAGSGQAAVAAERRLLAPLRAVADVVIDSGGLDAAEVGRRVLAVVAPDGVPSAPCHCTVSSFGFKYGSQPEADWIVDVRFLPNPFWVPELRPGTGLDPAVARHVLDSEDGRSLLDRLAGLFGWVAARSSARHRRHLHVAVGCTGGRHRSVAVAEALAARLRESGVEIAVRHRDVERPDPREAGA